MPPSGTVIVAVNVSTVVGETTVRGLSRTSGVKSETGSWNTNETVVHVGPRAPSVSQP